MTNLLLLLLPLILTLISILALLGFYLSLERRVNRQQALLDSIEKRISYLSFSGFVEGASVDMTDVASARAVGRILHQHEQSLNSVIEHFYLQDPDGPLKDARRKVQ